MGRALALRACFEHHRIRHLEGLLRHAWSFLDHPPIWQFEGNDSSWINCEMVVQKSLNEAWAAGREVCTLRGSTWCYCFDLVLLVQQNLSTGRARRIRCCDPFCDTFTLPQQLDSLLS